MKDITTKICEGKFKTSIEYDKTYELLKSLKDWYHYGVEHVRKNDGIHSPYIKSFTNSIETFVKTAIIDSLEYMGDDVTNEVIGVLSLDVNTDDSFDKIGDELVKYIVK
jgi:hypothetical protein